jgi:hypothetical protein
LPRRDIKGFLMLCEFQGGLAPLVGKPLNLGLSGEVRTWESWPGVRIEHLPFGVAVCIVDLTDCVPAGNLSNEQIGTDLPFGDFSLGRWAWKLENVRKVPPFAVKGEQGLFDVMTPDEFPF